MKQIVTRTVLLMISALVLAGCGKPTEEQRLAKFRGSMKYKAYRLASDKVTRLATAEYNKTAKQAVSDELVHATLGVVWFLSEQNEYSLMEADSIGTDSTHDAGTLGLCLKSIALSRMKYPGLAKSHYDELKAALAGRQNVDTNRIELEHKVFLVGLVAAGLYHGDPDLAKVGADALGSMSQIDYLPPLIGAVVEAKKGSPLKAVAQLRELSKSEKFSEHKKALMAEVADIIAKCPDQEKLGDDLTNRVLVPLVRRVLDDIFTAENMTSLLKKAKELPHLITGKAKAGEGQAARIRQEAEKCAQALLEGDYETVATYTHPRVVDLIGGKQEMIASMKQGIDKMRDDGCEFAGATVGQPEEPRKIGSWLVALVPQHIVMKVAEGRLHQDAHLLGISEDGGKTWSFVDVGPVTQEQFAKVFPELDGKVSLPAKRKPELRDEDPSAPLPRK